MGTKIDHDLERFTGKKVLRVEGYPSTEFAEDNHVFKIVRIVFVDGTAVFPEGEHDMPYIPAGPLISADRLAEAEAE